MRLNNLLQTPEISLQEGTGINRLLNNLSKAKKSLVFIASVIGISILALAVFVVMYYFSGNNTDIMTISVSGIILSAIILIFSVIAGLLSLGSYIAYFIISLNKKEINVAETMAEITMLFKIIKRINENACDIAGNILSQDDIAVDLKKYPALKERLLSEIKC